MKAEPHRRDDEALSTLGAILALLHAHTNTDFSRYRPSTIRRRIENRMIIVGADSLESYLKLLQASRPEMMQLLERLTIKVSSFYRDAHAFELIRTETLPRLARERWPEPVRIWSAGCGRGEEAYTLAMLLEEQAIRGVVCATDIDSVALAAARKGVYHMDSTGALPPDLAARHLEPMPQPPAGHCSVREGLRARVRFVPHDLMAETPPDGSPFDLVSCRNVLIYLRPDEQVRVVQRLYRALVPRGFLFLGEAEWPSRMDHLFRRCAGDSRVFRALA